MAKATRAGAAHPKLQGPLFDEPIFGEKIATPDPSMFSTRHPSDTATFNAIQDLLKTQVVKFSKSRMAPGDLYSLETAYGPVGPKVVEAIKKNGRIVFHALGDSGASNIRNYSKEIGVFDQVTDDIHSATDEDRPSFMFHLGDVVYNFGEAKYYFDQFYEPNRNYPPIIAIAGNHDSFILPGTASGDQPLTTFSRNFCSEKPVITPEAGSLHRTSMTQPGVYFALDAPFVRILGLFSNALEDPGVISSEKGRWPAVPDYQLDFLAAQLKRVKDEDYKGALLIAVHHPPFSFSPESSSGGMGGNHSSSSAMLRQIDELCNDAGVYPHAFLTAHAHNYQRYTRTIKFGGKELDVPFIVCGDGGHNVNPLVRSFKGVPAQLPRFGTRVDYLEHNPAVVVKELLLEKYNDTDYGYLRISVDAKQLRIGFHTASNDPIAQSRDDMVTVDLSSHTMVSN